MKNNENRMSVLTVSIILVILVVMVLVIRFFTLDNLFSEKENSENISAQEEFLDGVKDIEGDEYVKTEDGVRINISQNLENEKELEGFVFSDFYAYSLDGVTRIEFDVTNTFDHRETLEEFKMNIYTDKEKVGRFSCTGDEFAAGQTKRLNVTVNADIANMYDIRLEEVYNQEM